MILCSCTRAREQAVVSAVRSGADTVEAVAERCRAGSRCGGCIPAIEAVLAEHDRHLAHSAA